MRATLCALLGWMTGCHAFDTFEIDGHCGNRILEAAAGEDCDTFAGAPGTACGAPGTEHACRYVCGGEAACPEGFVCSLTGACEAPSGQLAAAEVLPIEGVRLRTGDVDGDGRADLLAFGGARMVVAFGDAAGHFTRQEVAPINALDGRPAVADLDVDGRADLVFPGPSGLELYRGDALRSLAPVPVAVAEVPETSTFFALRAQPPFEAHVLLAVTPSAEGPRFSVLGRATEARDVEARLAGIAVGPSGGSSPAIADLDGGGSADELVLTFPGHPEALVLAVACAPDEGPCSVEIRQEIALPPGTVADARVGPMLGTVAGAPRPDLYLSVVQGPELPMLTASLDIDGRFGPLTRLPYADALNRCEPCPPDFRASPAVRAVADLDADGQIDFINVHGIHLTKPGDPSQPIRRASTDRPWADVVVEDLNRDGTLDLVAVRPGVLDVRLAAPGSRYNAIAVETGGGNLGAPRLGDFDGDLYTDIAVVDGDTVVVFYAGRQGLPSERVVAASLAPRALMVAADGLDAVADLVAVTGDGVGGPDHVYALRGNGARRMTAPIARRGSVHVMSVVGHFLGAPDGEPQVVLGEIVRGPMGRAVGLRLGAPGRAFAESLFDLVETAPPDCPFADHIGVFGRAVDFDGDGQDELLVIETAHPEPSSPNTTEIPGAWRAWILRFAAADGRTEVRCAPLPPVYTDLPTGPPTVADFDGDGHLDVVVVLGPEGLGFGEARPPAPAEVAIWWGAAGGFGEPERQVLDPTPTSAVQLAVLAAGARPTLVLLTDTALLAADLSSRTPEVTQLTTVPRGAAELVMADADGDGLGDLVVSTGTTAFLYRQLPCTARRADEGLCLRMERESP